MMFRKTNVDPDGANAHPSRRVPYRAQLRSVAWPNPASIPPEWRDAEPALKRWGRPQTADRPPI